MNDEFYIGWEDKAPPRVRLLVRRTVIGLFLCAAIFALLLAAVQRLIGMSAFEWGTLKEFSGILRSQPYPQLLVPRPGAVAGQNAFSTYYLVKPFKFGLGPETADSLDGQQVNLRGTLIYRGDQTMIEVANGSLKPATDHTDQKLINSTTILRLGRQTLIGEIVDSKCFLGVMNPGQLTTHRACAIRCISGGIPPVLLVRQKDGTAHYFLLVSSDGKPVNKQALDFVAEPVEIAGEVERQAELLILRADPATYRRVTR